MVFVLENKPSQMPNYGVFNCEKYFVSLGLMPPGPPFYYLGEGGHSMPTEDDPQKSQFSCPRYILAFAQKYTAVRS